MSSQSAYDIGTRAWFPHEELGWISATCTARTGNNASFLCGENSVVVDLTQDESKLPPLRNPPLLETVDDLTNLSYLNEPAVLHSLKTRYAQKAIYTFSGIVLIALNPFAQVNSLYGHEIIQAYAGRRRGELEPHLYAIAQDAYSAMKREKKNQTIIVSGESGAGKTVSATQVMRFLATVEVESQGSSRGKQGITQTENKILATNPILESFGNSKTTRNSNSSRFGRYMQILFSPTHEIVGARIKVYLLERSRIVFQAATERNYHIFYQLCAGAPPAERKELSLGEASQFFYLKQGEQPVIPGVNDAADFAETCKALGTIGVTAERQWSIFRILAALLHIGNISIDPSTSNSSLSPEEPSLVLATKLLGISASEFAKWTTKRKIVTRGDRIVTNLTSNQAIAVRDSIAKHIYVHVFDWLVVILNDALDKGDNFQSWLSILDIYGFEHFKVNSYEQLLINTTNERLQHEFNEHVFQLEQKEYVAEDIVWNWVDFSDNQLTIDAIESKLGVLALLDEESRLPAGTDASFLNKLNTQLSKPEYKNVYKKARFGNTAFTIAHYAHDVSYEVEGFVDKNRDSVPEEQLALLNTTTNTFLKEVLDKTSGDDETLKPLAMQAPASMATVRRPNRKPTLGSVFKLSLQELMDTINETSAHYIRCIKPNDNKKAWEFEPQLVLSQLRACGVLETLRISCAGYPSRWTFQEFVSRYYMLIHSDEWGSDSRLFATAILKKSIEDEAKYQVGKTKIFLRAGLLADLEQLRTERFFKLTVLIQKNFRRTMEMRKYQRLREATIKIQSWWRMILAIRLVAELKRTDAAIKLQTMFRAVKQRQTFLKTRNGVILLQSVFRGHLARLKVKEYRLSRATLRLQSMLRGCAYRKIYKNQIRAFITIQSCWRRKLALKEVAIRKAEARSVTHFKAESSRLEQKVISLTQKLQATSSERAALQSKLQILESALESWKVKHEEVNQRAASLQSELSKPTVPKGEYDSLLKQKSELDQKLEDTVRQLDTRDAEVKKLVKNLSSRTAELKSSELEARDYAGKALEDSKSAAELRLEVATLREALTRASSLHAYNKTARNDGALVPQQTGGQFQLSRNIANGGPSTPAKDPKAKFASGGLYGLEGSSAEMIEDGADGRQRTYSLDGGEAQVPPQKLIMLGGQSPEDELDAILASIDILEAEINDRLLHDCYPQTQANLPISQICFPAHLICMVVQAQWDSGMFAASENILASSMACIQELVMNSENVIVFGAFWLSNVHEILSCIVASEEAKESHLSGEDFERLLYLVKHDLSSLEYNIYYALLSNARKKLEKMVGPAVIESQALPGFMVTEASGLYFNRFFNKTSPAYTMDDVFDLLDEVYSSLTIYNMEQTVVHAALTELLQMIGSHAFNDLVLRTKFAGWKRAMQIQYNVTRLDEWCKAHGIIDGSMHLESLQQAAKMLQLKMKTQSDIEVLLDVCWILTPAQVNKLVRQSSQTDTESPVPDEILAYLASRVPDSDNDVTLMISDESINYEPPAIRKRPVQVDPFIPANLDIPHLRRIATLLVY